MILKTGGCWVKWKCTQTETIKPFNSKILHTSQCFRRSSSQEILYVLLYFYLHDAVQLMFFALCHQGYRYLRVQIRSLCLYIKHQNDYELCKWQSPRNKISDLTKKPTVIFNVNVNDYLQCINLLPQILFNPDY